MCVCPGVLQESRVAKPLPCLPLYHFPKSIPIVSHLFEQGYIFILSSVSAWAGASPWFQAIHNRLLFSTLESPGPSLHHAQAAILLFSPICLPHTCTLWYLLIQAGYKAGGPLSDTLHPYCMAWQQMGVSIVLYTRSKSVGGIVVHSSLSFSSCARFDLT